ncbi:Mce protein [Mycobacterium sp. 050134]|uniref:Mce protein n=1 Tax=Mycobacterium sp. 050134 TaxID=3096111 RepID=UPI002ED7EAB7
MEEHAGAQELNPPRGTDAADASRPGEAARSRGPRAVRLHGRWLAAIAATLVVLTCAAAAGGVLALRAHRATEALDRAEADAVAAAKDCVAATQPADGAALPDSRRKLTECSTRGFGAQVAFYDAVLAEAYQAANVHVEVPDMRAAVERNNGDGSVIVLVAFRTKVSQGGAADRGSNYRLRVKMVPEDGHFKVAELSQAAE